MPGAAIIAIQPRPIACINNPVTTSGRSPNRLTIAPAIGAVTNSVGGPRQQPQPGAERSEAQRDLQKLRQQKQHAIHRGVEQQARGDAGAKTPANANSRIGTIGAAARIPSRQRQPPARHAGRCALITSRLVHPTALPRNRPHTSAKAATATSDEAGNIERRLRAETFAQARGDQSDRDQSDRQVDPEDPAPAKTFGDEAADRGADDQRASGYAAENAERACAFFPGKGAAQDAPSPSGITSAAPAPCAARAAISASMPCRPARRRPTPARTGRCRQQTSGGVRNGRRAPRPSTAAPRSSDCRH